MNKQLKTIGVVVLSVVALNRGLPAVKAQETTHALLSKPKVMVQAGSHTALYRTRPLYEGRRSRFVVLGRRSRFILMRRRFFDM